MTTTTAPIIAPEKPAIPQIPDIRGIAFVSITTLIMAYSIWIPFIPILTMYLMWLPHIICKGRITITPGRDIILPTIFSIYCLMTTLWSDYPMVSGYIGIQYASMILCAIIISRVVTFDAFIKGLSLGVFLVLLVTFHKGTFTLEGLFGSKNQAGFFAQIGILTSVLLFFHIKKDPIQKLIFSILPLIISIAVLIFSHSASSVLSVAAVLGVCIIMAFIARLPKSARPLILGILLFGAATFATLIAAFNIDIQGEILAFFGKDKTLTGRTDLWEIGIREALTNPILGFGYAAYWVQGRPEAERLWAEFYIGSRMGFHFHNLFIQTWVDLGLIGVILLITMLGSFIYKSLIGTLKKTPDIELLYIIGLTCMFVTRAFVEVDLLNSFGIGPFLFFAALPRLFRKQSETEKIIPTTTQTTSYP